MSKALRKADRAIFYSLCECMITIVDLNEANADYTRPCGWNGPLLIGCDVRDIPKKTIDIIANEEVIAVNQGRTVVLLLNRGSNELSPITAHWQDLGLDQEALMEIRDLWKIFIIQLDKFY
ncbi:hypothetical protein Cni_G16247 [Canna indica]|uniref:alpha-galactosidase n=1 Tax=Canna indica TaxID=4628 RepID=A0AAQ3KHG2_9LILI|nr:hypothetical protein Cni_G16247 [Canna indica]